MKPNDPLNPRNRFHTPLRHYHMINTERSVSWEEWIHGRAGRRSPTRQQLLKYLKWSAAVLGVFVLIAVFIGLWVELR